jgi:hypothetical protein
MCNAQNNMAAQAAQELKMMPDYTPINEDLNDKVANHVKNKRAEKIKIEDKTGYNGQYEEPLEPITVIEENLLGMKVINMGTDLAKRGYQVGKEFYNKSNMKK